MISSRTGILSTLGVIGLLMVFSSCNMHTKGKEIFQREKCGDCHTIRGKGGAVGPNLTNIGNRRSREYLVQQIKDPKSHNVHTAMPSFKHLPDQELKDLVDYLTSLK